MKDVCWRSQSHACTARLVGSGIAVHAPRVRAARLRMCATAQVEQARAQVSSLPHAGGYTELCTALRRQHDEEVSISATLQAQAAAHERAEAAHARAMARLSKAGSGVGGGGGGGGDEDPVAGLKEEVARLRRQVGSRRASRMLLASVRACACSQPPPAKRPQ